MPDHRNNDVSATGRLLGSLSLFAFGLMILGFLVAIDRPHWFHLKPASGAAQAMSLVAEKNGEAL